MVWISVALVDGLIRSSRASDWYNFADAVPGFVNIAIIITTTPSPPTHC